MISSDEKISDDNNVKTQGPGSQGRLSVHGMPAKAVESSTLTERSVS